jgi:hypothetical protein
LDAVHDHGDDGFDVSDFVDHDALEFAGIVEK